MKFCADLHIHSKYSRATSSELTPENLFIWARKKGINVVGTGDCLHPAWFAELKEKLEDAGNGLYTLNHTHTPGIFDEIPGSCNGPVSFMVTTEISCIYKKNDRVRKVHNVICLSSLEAAEKLMARLEQIGNIRSDGRPILGLDSHDLLSMTLDADPRAIFIPAHIWTPWFSVLGSKSGFDSIEECFDDLTDQIHAVETGLSSDPLMNWRLTKLDRFALVSNSDAHSAAKLGRECTVFGTDLTYSAIYKALADPNNEGLSGTIEFFPEEGKYHYDGHRKCGIRFTPGETIDHKGICPVCGSSLTVGVMARVEELADRPEGDKPSRSKPFTNLVPLQEIIGEAYDVGPESRSVKSTYELLLSECGSELHVLQTVAIKDIDMVAGPVVAEGVRRMREGKVHIEAGYDGEFGTIKLFAPGERAHTEGQTSLLSSGAPRKKRTVDSDAAPVTSRTKKSQFVAVPAVRVSTPLVQLNEEQAAAVQYDAGHLLIVAGPGTGKTHTLALRISHLVKFLPAKSLVLAITFTCKAADELQDRLTLIDQSIRERVTTGTIHSFCLDILRKHHTDAGLRAGFGIVSPADTIRIAQKTWPQSSVAERQRLMKELSLVKSNGDPIPVRLQAYDGILHEQDLIDYDDILFQAHKVLQTSSDLRTRLVKIHPFLCIDEYQDINDIQHKIFKLLAESGAVISAIGDPNQAIYGFRGSHTGFFYRFEKEYHSARILTLKKNYRSSPTIIKAGAAIISSGDQNAEILVPVRNSKGRIIVHHAPTARAEAEYVVHQIEMLIGGTRMFSRDSGRVSADKYETIGFGDIAVLYRLNNQRDLLQEAFERSGIPVQLVSDQPLHEQKYIALMLDCIRLMLGKRVSAERFCEIIELITYGIGPNASNNLLAHLKDNETVDLDIVHSAKVLAVLSDKLLQATADLKVIINSVRNAIEVNGVQAGIAMFSRYHPWDRELLSSTEFKQVWDRILRLSVLHNTIEKFLDALMLDRAEDQLKPRIEAVSLMTMHASKGLEWPVIFITGCEDTILPHIKDEKMAETGEERRLFYVAVTRAKDMLYLTRAGIRIMYGKTNQNKPSPFLDAIPAEIIEFDKSVITQRKPERTDAEQLNLF